METYQNKHPKVSKQYLAEEHFLFHCHVRIKTPLSAGPDILDECFRLLSEIDKKYNSYVAGSQIDLVNANAGRVVEVDDTAIWLLKNIDFMRHISAGVFNAGVMPLLKYWGFYRQEGHAVPDLAALKRMADFIAHNPTIIKGNSVIIKPGFELVTGSFIKAFAADTVVNFLRSEGVTDAIINAGGSTIVALNDESHPSWTVAIPHPEKSNCNWAYMSLRNACLSLSGNVMHSLQINGQRYGHVLNARTGFPSRNLQSCAITDSAFLGDMVSTALLADDVTEGHLKAARYYRQLGLHSYYIVGPTCIEDEPPFIHL